MCEVDKLLKDFDSRRRISFLQFLSRTDCFTYIENYCRKWRIFMKLKALCSLLLVGTIVLSCGGQVLAYHCDEESAKKDPEEYASVITEKRTGEVSLSADDNDLDLYRFVAPSTGTYAIIISGYDEASEDKPFVYVVDPVSGTKIARNIPVGESAFHSVFTADLNVGTAYYIYAWTYKKNGAADYSINIRKADGWVAGGGNWYYFADKSLQIGWKQIDDEWYLFDGNGKMMTGWQRNNGAWYYLAPSGNMMTGVQKIGGDKYLFSSDGKMLTGWQLIDGDWYYSISSGILQTGAQEINGHKYLFDDDGKMLTGWQKVDGTWYYYTPDSGYMATGMKEIDDETYFFEDDGKMLTGWKAMDGAWYYFASSGAKMTGVQEIDGVKYFLDGEGKLQSGWQTVDGTWYYMSSSGVVQTGWQNINSRTYYFDDDGEMLTGIQEIDGSAYFFSSDGNMLTGWQKVDEDWYYMNSSGVMQKGLQEINGRAYFFKSSGIMATSEYCDGYWASSDGTIADREVRATWRRNSTGWWYADSTGWYAKNQTLVIDGKSYNFDTHGYCTNP